MEEITLETIIPMMIKDQTIHYSLLLKTEVLPLPYYLSSIHNTDHYLSPPGGRVFI